MSSRTYATLSLSLVGALALTTAAHASYTETFTGGSNAAGWDWGFGNSIPVSGGNPGEYLQAEDLDTVGPILATTIGVSSPFVGNLRSTGVTGMSLDVRVESTDFPFGGEAFSMTLMLVSDKGNDVWEDDDWAYIVGNMIPQIEDGWVHYNFDFDATSDALPAGWVARNGENDDQTFHAGVTWADVVSNVDQVRFSMLDPEWFAIFQQWTVGADNVTVTTAPVPEPATLAALGLGAAAMLRRRKRSA